MAPWLIFAQRRGIRNSQRVPASAFALRHRRLRSAPHHPQLQTRNPELRTRNPKLGTPSPEPRTRNSTSAQPLEGRADGAEVVGVHQVVFRVGDDGVGVV